MSVGGFFDAAVDFATDTFSDFASDLAIDSFVDGFGTEFLTDIGGSFVDFGGDLFSSAGEFFGDIGGSLYDQVGSFAGNADWFNATSFGDILSGPTAGFSEFFGDITSNLPGPSNFIANTVNSVTSAIPQVATTVARSAIANATGLPPNLIPGFGAGSSLPNIGSILSNPASVFSTPGFGAALTVPALSSIFSGPTPLNPSIVPGFGGALTQLVLPRQGPATVNPITGALSSLPGTITEAFNFGAQPVNIPQLLTAQIQPVFQNVVSDIDLPVNQQLLNTVTQFNTSPTDVSAPAGNNFIEFFNPETGQWDVFNTASGETVSSGLSQQEAILAAQDLSITDGETLNVTPSPQTPQGVAFDDDGNLLPGFQLDEDNNPVFVGGGFVEPTTQALADAGRAAALRDQARQQQTIRSQRQNKAQSSDWRVRLRLAPNSNYLYNDPNCGPVLYPLQVTDGVIFPYTPTIDIGYKANYTPYDLTHSNYRGYFYQNSAIDSINVRATFTAQDTQEANYLLAVIHFFRSVTKMFYGQDAQRGSPPPLTYLSGFGDFQFSEHPCVVSQFNYNLPSDVNYIRAQTSTDVGTNLQPTARNRQYVAGNPLSYALQRLASLGQGINKGALDNPFAPSGSLGAGTPSYVPTKIDISLVLLPMQSRQQVSKQFSLKGFANGNLLRGGFW